MITNEQAQQLVSGGGNVVGRDGEKIGQIGQVFLDDRSNEPEWVTAKTGLFGTGESFVPLREARIDGSDVHVPYDKATVKDAPRIDDADSHLSEGDEDRLFAHYRVDDDTTGTMSTAGTTGTGTTGPGTTGTVGSPVGAATGEHPTVSGHVTDGDAHGVARGDLDAEGTAGHDVSGPNTDSAMTRSEEQLHVGTETRTTGRARLRKYIVTEDVTTTVPVSHEEVRVEREPITEANVSDATAGGELTSEEHEVVLHEERPVVEKETVPVERVRVDVDTVTGEEQVDEQVRKEQIDLDEDTARDTVGADDTRRDEVDRG